MAPRAQSKRKNIMREFTISELSAVDRPAQAHARMSIMKREQETEMQHLLRRPEVPIGFSTLESAMAHLKQQGMSRADAMSKAARENPGLVQKYQREGDARVQKQLKRMSPASLPPAVDEFEGLVHHVMGRDRCDRATAMQRARAEAPALFRAYQSA